MEITRRYLIVLCRVFAAEFISAQISESFRCGFDLSVIDYLSFKMKCYVY